jgi:hypothetical protein
MSSDSSHNNNSNKRPISDEPSKKKIKMTKQKNNEKIDEFLDTIWDHYCNYFFTDNDDDDEEEEDHNDRETDQLMEILDMIQSKLPEAMNEVWELPSSLSSSSSSLAGTVPIGHQNNDNTAPTSTITTTSTSTKANATTTNNTTNNSKIILWHRRKLLPVLISVISTLIADAYIEEYMDLEWMIVSMATKPPKTSTPTDTSINHQDVTVFPRDPEALQQQKLESLNTIRQHLLRALQSFPYNATAIQMSTNYLRMTRRTATTGRNRATTTTTTTTKTNTDTLLVAPLYSYAADMASYLRTMIIPYIKEEEDDDDHDTNLSVDVKEWMVALLLNQVCGVDEVDDEEDDDDNEDDNEQEPEDDKDDNKIVWSSSKVEEISRYMSSMMYSMIQQHDQAFKQLQLLHITHRLHPKLWQTTTQFIPSQPPQNTTKTTSLLPSTENTSTQQQSLSSSSSSSSSPVLFRGVTNAGHGSTGSSTATATGIIPSHLYDRLCKIFHPGADYWYSSNYSSRGYFSFYMDLPPPNGVSTPSSATGHSDNNSNNTTTATASAYKPRNLIDDVVCRHLLPLLQQSDMYQGSADDPIVGYEWWVHTRAMTANLGHNLHFDTDEALLRRDGTVSHPCISSVLYLTGGGENNNNNRQQDDDDDDPNKSTGHHSPYQGGPTIVLDQTPDSTTNAERAWYCHPINNSFMIFPGNLLHGVLPCFDRRNNTHSSSSSNGSSVAETTNESSCESVTATKESLSDTLIHLLSDEVTLDQLPDASKSSHDSHRLTLMVGFWTRNVPADMDPELTLEDRLYGPCSPLPSMDDTQWVRDLCVGYVDDDDNNNNDSDVKSSSSIPSSASTTNANIVAVPLPCVSPAWEEIGKGQPNDDSTKSSNTSLLTIPRDIDHRFFVIDAPQCFRNQLMEAQNCVVDDAVFYNVAEIDDDFDNE